MPRPSPGVYLAAVLLLTSCGATAPEADPTTQPVEVAVERVIDGDSLELTIDGEPVEARLLGINAPELRSSAGDDTCTGTSARGELETSIDGADTVGFVPDEVDRFGRRLGVLVVDGVPVTEMMVDAGWALALWSGENEGLSVLMIEAADAERGMWGPACGQPVSADVAITEVQADAPGDDRENLTEEWVTVSNDGASPIDLDGWIVRDETTSNRFTITDFVLDAGASVRFRSGQGRSGGGNYFLGEAFPVWSNRGETVLLVDPDGVIAAHAFVP